MKMHHNDFPVEIMASILGVSKVGYYRFLQGKPSQRNLENKILLKKIKEIHENSYETYGSPRIHAELKDLGETCSRSRVARIMRTSIIAAKMHKRFKKTTRQSDKPYFVPEDLIQQDFTASGPNEAWVADITYVLTQIGWVYCAVVLDLFSRRAVGVALSSRMTVDLVLRALQQALIQRRPSAGIIHHSDRGSQYTAKALKILADDYGVQLSMGRVANAFGRVKQWRSNPKILFPLPATSNRTCATHASGFRLDHHAFAFGTLAMTSAIA